MQRVPESPPPPSRSVEDEARRPLSEARVEIRRVERNQLFIDGKPVGPEFE